MATLATRAGAFSELAEVTDRLNRAQVKWIADLTNRHYSGSGPIGILGLTYKPDTDVVDESFGLLLAGELTSANLSVVVYDPSAEETRVRAVNERVEFVGSAQECVEKSDVVVISTPWAQFHQIPLQSWSRHNRARTVIDCWRAFTRLNGVEGVRYVRLGLGEEVERAAEAVSTD
jgi:UDPglucose 6-dehydrogenase